MRTESVTFIGMVAWALACPLLMSGVALGQACDTEEVAAFAGRFEADNFGCAVGVSDGRALVGASWDPLRGNYSGVAYLFDLASGEEVMSITSSEIGSGDYFGHAVTMSGGRAIVGAPGAGFAGGAYVFDAASGEEVDSLRPRSASSGMTFGRRVAMDGDRAMVASGVLGPGSNAGRVHYFDLESGSEIGLLRPDDLLGVDQRFGDALAMSGSVLVVGASGDEVDGVRSGSAYLYAGSDAALITKLLPPDAAESDFFGSSVAAGEGVVVVGAPGRDAEGLRGAAYVFDAASGAMLRVLSPDDPGAFESFGKAVQIEGGVAFVSSSRGDDVSSGTVHLFDVSTGAQIGALRTSDPVVGFDYFGDALAVDGSAVVVGSAANDNDGGFTGSAAYFEVGCAAPCPGDLDGNGSLNYFDIAVLLQGFQDQDLAVDLSGDGVLNFFDVSIFLQSFASGCP